ncbi:thiamine phosphate synthase [Methylobacterium thuringiense]|uniref:Thiamine-phosphate synthase n=1 Tax=Methylobacterium thuringiense TaxID=1003091 RepID=A0ABQ4TFF5_9HYPH|nr:Thiamine-phosphate synthase [Methylobacterium thuringiense]
MIPSPLLVVTDRHGSARPLVETVRAVLDGGARWIWFRDKDLEPATRRDLALELLALVRTAGGRLTIGGDAVLAAEIDADGVQLGAAYLELVPKSADAFGDRAVDLEPSLRGEVEAIQGQRTGVGVSALDCFATLAMTDEAPRRKGRGREAFVVGVSAHSLGDVRRAREAGADYATLSPIFTTASKPGYGPALGLDGLHEAAAIGLPVVALGGIAPEHAVACREAGAAGIAVMGGIMRAADPAAATRRYLQALHPLT